MPKYRRNPFKYEAAYHALEALARQQAPASPEIGAIALTSCAWVNPLRFLLDTHQVDAFCANLDKGGLLHTPTGAPTGELDRPAVR